MNQPLADRIRPKNLNEVVGQKHLLGEGKVLRRIIESGNIPNLIFYGPSGVGKTTVANIISESCNKKLYKLNATTASISDIKEIISNVGTFAGFNGILLYLDEIQYFNKKQQQTLLEFIENGDITLIASTTENPYFYIYNAILSRSSVFEFKQVPEFEIPSAIKRAVAVLERDYNAKINITDRQIAIISRACGGDVRKAINITELCVLSSKHQGNIIEVENSVIADLTGNAAMRYDKSGDEHYDILSAFQKSMRGSDPDAAIHYLARLLKAGDLPSACRRLLVCACEDVGLAYPQIIPIVKACVDSALMVGLPEARIPLANAVILVALSPKSNSAYTAIDTALADIDAGKVGPIPRHLQNMHYDGDDVKVKGQFYKYPHDYPNHYIPQQYLPDLLKDAKYYKFGNNKFENSLKSYWELIKNTEER
ncbi:MAG TPA: replication-associated recombination protein A [Clostridiales bacterium]|nr:replication-associated recombination protein A [Clostridiales bacterium]